VLVEIKAASLNFPDLLIVQNKYQMKPPLPFVPGSEYAGVVAGRGRRRDPPEGGPERGLPVGHRRLRHPHHRPGRAVHAAARRLPARGCAAFIMIYATSHHALVDRAQLKAGETVLVLGAAGGVGTAAIQIAKAAGAKVIAAASTDEKCALCKTLGPTPPSTTAKRTCATRSRRLTDGKGPDVIYDPVGGDFAEPAFRSIAWRGRYLVVGFAAGPSPRCR
jgi:NADPH2:quinone reductase